jgi:hypothetical protein
MTSRVVEGYSMDETRRRFPDRKTYPHGLDSNGARDEAAQGDPASMRSQLLACRAAAFLFIIIR